VFRGLCNELELLTVGVVGSCWELLGVVGSCWELLGVVGVLQAKISISYSCRPTRSTNDIVHRAQPNAPPYATTHTPFYKRTRTKRELRQYETSRCLA